MHLNYQPLLHEKVLVFGDREVGKTSLIRNIQGKSLITNHYYPSSNEGISYIIIIVYCESKCHHFASSSTKHQEMNIQFIEINNIESNQILLPPLQFHCCLALLLYDQSRYETFIKIKNIAQLLHDHQVNKILIANKSDLSQNDIDEAELKSLLNLYKETMQYVQISNTNKVNIISLKSLIENVLSLKDSLFYKEIVHPRQLPNESTRLFKIILLGDSEVGKTSYFKRVFSETFAQSVASTIGLNDASLKIQIDSVLYQIHIWDTAGQERFRSITKLYYNKADGIIMMFDLTNTNSFANLKHWAKDIDEFCIKDSRKCLIGTKLDLIDERKVRLNDSVQFATEHSMTYCEVSNKWDLNVSNSIFAFIYEIYSHIQTKERLKMMTLDKYNQRSWCCF